MNGDSIEKTLELSRQPMSKYSHAKKRNCRVKKKYKKRKSCNSVDPITSYGLLVYAIRENTPIFLLYQRRDNFEYMDFLRGVWGSKNQLPILFSLMSQEERDRIRDYTFEELWDDLWVYHDCRIYKDGYAKAKKKYESIKNSIPHILEITQSFIEQPPWGFPKGKKNGYHEDPLVCALREFQEETKLSTSELEIIKGEIFTENFKGSNGKSYTTHYYLAKSPDFFTPQEYDTPQCIRKTTISEEASNVNWFDYKSACNILNSRRQEILLSALKIIQSS